MRGLATLGEDMRRNRHVEPGAAGTIGIDVRADVEAARPCRLDPRDRLRHQLAPQRRIGGLDVKNLDLRAAAFRSEEHTSELQSLMRISYAVFCLKKKKHITNIHIK